MNNNSIILEGCIEQFKKNNAILLNDSEVFELFSLAQTTKVYDLDYENIFNSIVDGGNDGGIDSIIVMVDDKVIESVDELTGYSFSSKTKSRFVISQCKKENSFKENTLDKLITTIPELFDLEKNEKSLLTRFNSDIVCLALLVNKVWELTAINGGSINIDFVYTCNAPEIEINNVFEQKVEQLKKITEKSFSNKNVTYTNYSSSELIKLYHTHKTSRLTMEFKDQPLSTSYDGFGIGYVGMVKLGEYKKFLTEDSGKIRDDLFESNIRHFQGSVDVNKKIKTAVETVNDRDFWWLNNGITIIAEDPNQIGKKLSIDNVQIVNGLQTSYSIFNNHSGDVNDERSVLIKVIINNKKDIVDDIIASTNSQNPVSPALLRATGEMQRNLETFFYNKGYFYDRRKNYYKNQNKPLSKIFSIQYTAQAVEAIAFNDPHSARSKPSSLLKDDKIYNQLFDQSQNYLGYLNCCLINKTTNDYWSNISDNVSKNKTSNFKLHLAWLSSKVIANNYEITFDEISSMDLSVFTEEKFKEALDFLLSCITDFETENPDSNLINMAKSGEFTEYIINKLKIKYK